MKINTSKYLILFFIFLSSLTSYGQERRKIQIDTSGFITKNEKNYPGATILTRDNMNQVKISHEGIIMWCDEAIHYGSQDFIEAYGNVKINQGDTIIMTSKYVEYSGKTQLAIASGDVLLTDPTSTITSDTLYFDRIKQQAFYQNNGQVVRDSSGTITSKNGRYYMDIQKYQFVDNVKLVNPEYVIDSDRLDFYSERGYAYLFGPTTITSNTSVIYCERGFYDTNRDLGYFLKNSKINYDERLIEGDSLYFNRNKNFASATNNIKITDTINKAIVKGHYAEIFRDKDSIFITKRALAITVQEKDSIYMHSDTIMVTGTPENRITRAYYNAKIFKSNLSGKADSIHVNHKKGLTQLINLNKFTSTDAFSSARHPILWNLGNQMTGDSIHLQTNLKTEQLDSLKVFDNAFLISKDTIGEANGFDQIKGQKLFGLFRENELYHVDIIKNAEKIYYSYNENQELVGIDKSKSGKISIELNNNAINEMRLLQQVDGSIYPEDEFPKNASKLRGFVWRDDERPKSVEDLFKDDPPLNLPNIKGLKAYIPQEEFFDENLMKRINASGESVKNKKEKNKAARRVPKTRQGRQNIQKLNEPLKKGQKLGDFLNKQKNN
ncbi:MAG: OstA-like protein [Flavobacteriaceae bacterium]|nr:OstA-like protein [Flavobacteriaceae bacterium]